jgi:DNA-binding SARP family transcriptional activator
MMRFRVLGPVTALPQTPTALKARSVLAVLLSCANQTVSALSLIDELWDDAPPRTAMGTLQVYISQLRHILGEDSAGMDPIGQPLTTVAPGYSLRVAPEDLDVSLFEARYREGCDALARGQDAVGAQLLCSALDLWRGPALSGVRHGPILSRAAVRLEELRLNAFDRRMAAELRLGRHMEVTGELMVMTHEYPLHEPLYAHLMTALFRSHRRADAVRVYSRAHRTLVNELGIQPGPELRALLRSILDADDALDSAGGVTSGITGGTTSGATDTALIPPGVLEPSFDPHVRNPLA